MKLTIKSLFFVFSLVLLSVFASTPDTLTAGTLNTETMVAAAKRPALETIYSKSQLINSFKKHLTNLDSRLYLKISSSVAKTTYAVFDIVGKNISDNLPASVAYDYISTYSYDFYRSGSFYIFDLSLKYYDLSNLKKEIKHLKVLQKKALISTESKLKSTYLKHFYNLDKSFSLKLSKKLFNKYGNDFFSFLETLENDPKYNDLYSFCRLSYSVRTFSNSYVINITLKTDLTKAQAKKIVEAATPIITTREEFISALVKATVNLEENIQLNVSNNVVNFNSQSDSGSFFNELYQIPEYIDIFYHIDSPYYNTFDYNGYFKFTKTNKYSITKEETDYLDAFVSNWAASYITPGMTDEEKARAVNDYMVHEYRYTYGDRGELTGNEKGQEKLGKYSVYTSFALLYGKGGVCNSKAIMFYRLAKAAGLEVLYVTGDVPSGPHAWNMVKVAGNWYHVDNTWNRGQYEGASEYEYFNDRAYYLKGDATMSIDHSWDRTMYPACPMDYPEYVPIAGINRELYLKNAA